MNARAQRVELDYPYAAPPEHDSYIEVAPGLRWLRFPLPFALDHINLWLLDDGDGWVLIDTGINSEISRALWERHFETTLEGRPITRIVVTHFHPDHVGNAGWLVARWRPEFLTTRTEWLMAATLKLEMTHEPLRIWGDFYRAAGIDEDRLQAIVRRGESYSDRVDQMPMPFTRLIDGEALSIGGRVWRVVIGTGHSPELICLYCEADRLFISSDQVLPGISPNVSVTPTEPASDPLSEFLDSGRKLMAIAPEAFVLPMHGRPFYRLHERLDEVARHHRERLDLTIAACREPLTVARLLPLMFSRPLDLQQTQFAVGEALAHLNHLATNGALTRIAEPGKPTLYRQA
jgi:glyoxylase-like metal-dependent hydrolase (beta-lactamase superfamily II)